MFINQSSLATLFTGFKTVFNEAFAGAPSHWSSVAMVVPSGKREEVYAWLGRMPRFREWLGERVVQNLRSHDYTIKNRSFEMTVGVPREDIEDDSFGVYGPFIQEMGHEAKTHPDELVFGLLGAGFTTTGYDGQNFFDADHPVLDEHGNEQSVSNLAEGEGPPWFLLDTSRPVKPLIFQKRKDYKFVAMDREEDEHVFMRNEYRYGVDARCNAGLALWQLAYASKLPLNEDNYAAARAAMLGLRGDGGRPLKIRPTLLVVPPALERDGLRIIKAEHAPGGGTNIYQGSAELLVTPWLS